MPPLAPSALLSPIRILVLALLAVPCMGFGCYEFNAPRRILGSSSPDPSLLLDDKFYVYTTSANGKTLPVHSSTDLDNWTSHGDAMGRVGNWSYGAHWAPEVVKKGSTFYLFYTSYVNGLLGGNGLEHAIGVACSSSPLGPFDDCGAQYLGLDLPVYRDPSNRGVIDAEVVKHGGSHYLLWSLDWGPGGFGSSVTRKIQGCRLTAAMNGCVSGTFVDEIIRATRNNWEKGVVENPTMVMGQEGHYILYYSGGFYGDSYATGTGFCGTTPLSGCTKGDFAKINDQTFPGVQNPGGLDLIPFLYGTVFGVMHAAPDWGTRKTYLITGQYETFD